MIKAAPHKRRSYLKTGISTALLVSFVSLGALSTSVASTNERSNRFYAEAVAEYEQGNMAEAIIQLRNAVQQDPENMDARLLLGKMYLEDGTLASAVKELEIVYERRRSDEAELLLGQAYFASGRFDDALRIVSNDALTSEMVVQKQIVRGDALLAQQKDEAAMRAYERALEVDADNKRARYGLARALSIQGEINRATRMMEELTEADPSFAPAWMLKGEIALSRGNKNEAFEAFNKAVELTPNDVNAYVARARAYLISGSLDEVKQDIEKISRLAPENPISKYLSASRHYAQNNLDAAEADYVQIEERFRSFPPAVLLGALIKFKQGDLNQSEALLARYLLIEPNNPEAKRIMALVRIRNDDVRGGVNMLNQLVRADPDDIQSLQFLASAYIQMKDFESASQTYKAILERGKPEHTRRAGLALRLLSEEPVDDLIAGGEGPGREILVVLNYINSDQLDKAETEITKLKEAYPDNPIVMNLEGGLWMARKDYVQARQSFENALEQDPAFISAIDNLDRIDYIEGTPENVELRLRDLLQRAPSSEPLIIRQVQYLSNNNRLPAAIELLNRSKDTVERSEVILQALVRANFGLSNLEAAGQAAKELAMVADTENELAFATQALIDTGLRQDAVAAAQKLVALDNMRSQSYLMLARAHVANQDLEQAQATLVDAFAKNPGDAVIARGLVDIALGLEDQKRALSVIDQLAQVDPYSALRLKANTLLKIGDSGEAIRLLAHRMRDNPSEEIAIDLFLAHRSIGDISAALKVLETWLASNPQSRRALTAYAGILLDMDRLEEASDAYAHLIELDPNNIIALNNYAWIRNDLGGKADALDYAERAYALAPSSAEIADTYGWLLVQNGKLKEGLEILRAAAGIGGNNPQILYHLAYTLAKTGQNEDAVDILGTILERGGEFASRNAAEDLYARLK